MGNEQLNFYWCKTTLSNEHDELLLDGPARQIDSIYPSVDDDSSLSEDPYVGQQSRLRWMNRKGSHRSTFVPLDPYTFTCSADFYVTFTEPFRHQVTAFPSQIDGVKYVSFRPSAFIDAFDCDKSSYRKLPSGSLTGFKKIFLTKPLPANYWLVGLAGQLTLRTITVVTSDFLQRYEELDCSGLTFEQLNIS